MTVTETNTVYFCYPECPKAWVASWLAFLLGRDNSFAPHVCFKIGYNFQVDYNASGVQFYHSEEPYRPVSHALVVVNKDNCCLKRALDLEANVKFSWEYVLPTLKFPNGFRIESPEEHTCCSFTLYSLTGVKVHRDPQALEGVLRKLI
jgi:hypothetical protein